MKKKQIAWEGKEAEEKVLNALKNKELGLADLAITVEAGKPTTYIAIDQEFRAFIVELIRQRKIEITKDWKLKSGE